MSNVEILNIILGIVLVFQFSQLMILIYITTLNKHILERLNNINKIEVSQVQINKAIIELIKSEYMEILESIKKIKE